MLFLSNFNEDSQGFGTNNNSHSRGEFPQKSAFNNMGLELKNTKVGFGGFAHKN
jgi:hypothetical protein